MTYWKSGLLFFGAFIIQTSLLNLVNIAGYTPNLLLCLTVICSFLYEKELYGPVWGAVFGLLYDVCYSYVTGPTAIALVITALLVMALREYANIENMISMIIISIISFFSYYTVNWILHAIAGNSLGFVYAILHVLPAMIYSFAVIILLYILMIKNVSKYRKDRYLR